jgi:hypothetical protein
MTERSYQDAVQVLKDRLGGTWEGVEAEGRDEMVRILQEDLGYSHREATDAIDAMVESGTLRYIAEGPVGGMVAPPLAAGTGTSSPATTPAPAVMRTGHWQIGGGVVESSGRKGQVTPT